MVGIPAVVIAGGWLLYQPRIKRTAPVFRFALAANLTGISVGLLTGGSLMLFCMLMAITQLLILLIGGFLLFSDRKHAHFKSLAWAICLLITPYGIGLAVAAGMYQLWHQETDANEIQPPPPSVTFSPY